MTIDALCTIIIVYGPNDDLNEAEKDKLWDELQLILDEAKGKIYIAGDFSGGVGNNNKGTEETSGTFGEKTANSNGGRLIDFCLMNNLIIANTRFAYKNIYKYTREDPSCNEKSIIDFILTATKKKNAK